LTVLDAFLILLLLRRGMRLLEAAVMALIGVIAVSLLAEILLAHPDFAPIAAGLLPHTKLITNPGMLYIGVGIIGATVMPHNLYLHSALVQSRSIGNSVAEKKAAIMWALLDSCVALLMAFFVNAAILVMAASVFHANGHNDVQDLGGAFSLLAPILGNRAAPIVFGTALLASGLNATVTGTLAGQVVMEGLLRLNFSAAFQRLLTRGLAVIPVLGVIALMGRHGVGQLLVLSQVILSLQLPFAMLPLIYFTSTAAGLAARAGHGRDGADPGVRCRVAGGHDVRGEGSASFREQKEAKNFLTLDRSCVTATGPVQQKFVGYFFFQKSNCVPAFFSP
jgi:manganese transport protein